MPRIKVGYVFNGLLQLVESIEECFAYLPIWVPPEFLPGNWLQVFKRAHTAVLGSGGGPEQRTSLVPSEKCAVGWGRDNDEMRMITASFVRAIERFAGDLYLHFLPLFQ